MRVVSPIDLLPEFFPVVGPLVVIGVGFLLRNATRSMSREPLLEAWSAKPSPLGRLIGRESSCAALIKPQREPLVVMKRRGGG